MERLYFVLILRLSRLIIVNAELSNTLIFNYEKPECDANKTYKAKNITCICTDKGEWPNDDCYFHFKRLNSYDKSCEPDKFVFIDCNVCRCGRDGKIDRAQCTQHKCNALKESRRTSTIESTCKPKMWYSFDPCRICYCLNKHKLICNNEINSSKIHLQNYVLNECGKDLLVDMNKLMTGNNALRQKIRKYSDEIKENGKESVETSSSEYDINTLEIYKESTVNPKKVHKPKTKNKMIYEVSKTSNPVKSNTKTSKLHKGTKEKIWKKVSEKENSSKNDVSNVLDSILNLVLRKSLVSLDSRNKCKPGSTTRVECNNCFCLTNGKLLCTKNKCK